VRQDDKETSDSFNRMASILREVNAQDIRKSKTFTHFFIIPENTNSKQKSAW
jgi:hypothetical protein